MAKFKAIVVEKADKGQTVSLTEFDEANLMDGDVTVRVDWSTINYKDGLAITGKAPVVRRFPMIPGIDFAGEVEASSHPDWKPGDKVILNGWGTGETHLGGYGEKSRVKGQWLVRLPATMSPRDAMAIGTAGYTAMLAVMALERHGLTPAHGPVVVTGAAGGVGSVAIALLAKLGFQVVASTGRREEADYLKGLDRLCNGVAISPFVGYEFLSRKGWLSFYSGFEPIFAFTQNRRSLNYDTNTSELGIARKDILLNFKLGIYLPFYLNHDYEKIEY